MKIYETFLLEVLNLNFFISESNGFVFWIVKSNLPIAGLPFLCDFSVIIQEWHPKN